MAAAAPTPPDAPLWHAMAGHEVAQILGTNESGLDDAAAAERLQRLGPNRLPSAPPPHPLRRFLRQFHNLLIYVLLVAGVVALALGEHVDALVIGAVVLLNALIGVIQEGKAEQSLAAIRRLIDPTASVLRAGRRQIVAADTLVCGDVVLLEAGDRVSADLRLIDCRNLRMEGALLCLAVKAGGDLAALRASWPRRDSLPFDTRLRWMAVLHHDHRGHAELLVKGAPERVLALCNRKRGAAGSEPLDPAFWEDAIRCLATSGRRVLALARRDAGRDETALQEDRLAGGCFGVMAWSLDRYADLDRARTLVVNTLVAMEVAYLFSVRYVHGSAFSWRGLLGTPVVLAGLATTLLAQLAFTYLPAMQAAFHTQPLDALELAVVLGTGAALLLVVEIEKTLAAAWRQRATDR